MWLFTKIGFYSVTQSTHKKTLGQMQVRARDRKDLENLRDHIPVLAEKEIHEFPNSDYKCRIFMYSHELIEVMLWLTQNLDYSNFKNEIAGTPDQKDKYHYYSRVWGVMHGYQNRNKIIEEPSDGFQTNLDFYNGHDYAYYDNELEEEDHVETTHADSTDLRRWYDQGLIRWENLTSEEQDKLLYSLRDREGQEE